MSWEKYDEEHKSGSSGPSFHAEALKSHLGHNASITAKKGSAVVSGMSAGYNDSHNALTGRGFAKIGSTPRIDKYQHPDGTIAEKKQTYDRGAYKTSITLKKE